MPEVHPSSMARLMRIVGLGAGVLALAGCASNDSFVQTGTGSGYYTSAAPYPPPGYYDVAGFDAYDPYNVAVGDYDIYGPSFTFGLGLGSACGWGCAGDYGGWPWYYGAVDYRGWRHHHRHPHRGGTVVSAARPWLGADRPRVPPVNGTRGAAPLAVPERPVESFASRHPLESTSFALRRDVGGVRPLAGISAHPAYMDRSPVPAIRSMPIRMGSPHDFAQPAARTAPRAEPIPSHSNHAGPDRIR